MYVGARHAQAAARAKARSNHVFGWVSRYQRADPSFLRRVLVSLAHSLSLLSQSASPPRPSPRTSSSGTACTATYTPPPPARSASRSAGRTPGRGPSCSPAAGGIAASCTAARTTGRSTGSITSGRAPGPSCCRSRPRPGKRTRSPPLVGGEEGGLAQGPAGTGGRRLVRRHGRRRAWRPWQVLLRRPVIPALGSQCWDSKRFARSESQVLDK